MELLKKIDASACDHLKNLAVHEYEYLKELIGLVAQEVLTVTE